MDNFLIIKSGCPYCREAIRVIEWINMKLPIQRRIKIFDNYYWENYGMMQHKIATKFTEEDGFSGYPFLYLSGIVVDSCQKELLKPFLEAYFEDDFIMKTVKGGNL